MNSRITRNNSMLNLSEIDPNALIHTVKSTGNTTDKICGVLNYLTFLPSLIYNICWIVFFKNIFLEMDSIESGQINEVFSIECPNIYEYLNFSFAYIVFSLIKSIVIVLLFSFLCTREGDCNIICLIIKILLSYFPSIYVLFSFKIQELNSTFENILNNNSENFELYKSICFKMFQNVNSFYNMEYAYCCFISCLILTIPVGSILMAIKECCKGKNYLKKNI